MAVPPTLAVPPTVLVPGLAGAGAAFLMLRVPAGLGAAGAAFFTVLPPLMVVAASTRSGRAAHALARACCCSWTPAIAAPNVCTCRGRELEERS